ncbi:MAG: TIGR03619 family F420-dependent LLM class oxidoreductase [Nocardioides sp.]|uniref:TIGR03619 family F420-dependent LLM class oxidoreductase n=1 Tax=Nocardioides sp. TaxID=35761 RepID=UPI0039E498A3
MEFGIGTYPTHDSVDPGVLARLVEERGHNTSLFLAEHTHLPAAAYRAGQVPRRLGHLYDPFVALTAAAAVTSRLRVGTGICLVVERDPIITAKQVASLDHLSGGRFEFGVGAGWLRESMLNHGTDPRTRMRLMADRIAAMKAIWTEDVASYHGEFVRFDEIVSWPKPIQRPHPPILVGGDGPTVFDRVLGFGDAWLPNVARDPSGGLELVKRIKELQARADRTIDVVVVSTPADPAVLERLAKAGCRRAVHWIPATGKAGVERSLDRWEEAVTTFTGEAETVHRSTAEIMGATLAPST